MTFASLLAKMWAQVVALIRDLIGTTTTSGVRDADVDDILDAAHDEDGTDVTGL